MRALAEDLRYATRTLIKSRGFTAAAIAVLALGIGANAAIFSVVNTVLLRPMPFPDPARIVKVLHVPPAAQFPGTRLFSVSPANYIDWRASNHSFSGMAAYQTRPAFVLSGIDRPENIVGVMAGSDFFSVLGTSAEIGRVFSADDELPGHGNVVVISHSLWQTHFASNPNVLGRTMILNDQPYTVIGVMPAKFRLKAWSPLGADVWMPLGWDEKTRAVRDNHNYLVVAKLNPRVSIAQALAEMDTISNRLALQYPEADRGWGATVFSLSSDVVGDIKPACLVLMGAVGFVLLIACANVANLITARNLARNKELAVRAALGASRGRTLQQLLSESILLSLAGGLAGIGIAAAVMPLLIDYVNQKYPITEIPLDARVLLVTLSVSLLTGILAGAIPAWRGSKTDLNDALKQGGRASTDHGAQFTRNALVAAEVALSLMLLAGAGLMIRSLWLLTGVNPGFDPRNVLTMACSAPHQITEPHALNAHFDRLLQNVRALPGVQSAGLIDSLPLEGGSVQPFTIEGRPPAMFSQQPTVAVRVISPGYLGTMRIRLLRGRDFEDADNQDHASVVLISESMARQFWPGEDPVGKHLRLSFAAANTREIAGVVGDVKQDGLDAAGPVATLYEPSAQLAAELSKEDLARGIYFQLAVRTATRPENYADVVKGAVESLDPTRPVRDVRTMQSLIDESISDRRMSMLLLAAFAGLALVLAAFGLYSVLAYTIRRRVREIGIRVALGARIGDVLRIVALESLRPTIAGMAIGITGSLLLSRLLNSLIFGIRPTDPLTFISVAIVLALIAMIASIIPAWRATRIDPVQVLREE